jgi:hypothetical protein
MRRESLTSVHEHVVVKPEDVSEEVSEEVTEAPSEDTEVDDTAADDTAAALESYESVVMADKPVAYWSMAHTLPIRSQDRTSGTPCDGKEAVAKAVAEGESCGIAGGVEFGDPCVVDGAICFSSVDEYGEEAGLLGDASNKATKFTGGDYVRIPDHPEINTNATGYPFRTVELWFNVEQADGTKRIIFSEGNQHHAGLSMYVAEEAGTVFLNMFAWDRGIHDTEFGTVDVDMSICPNPIKCEISTGHTYYAVMEFNGEARTFKGYIRRPNTDGTEPTLCGEIDQLPVGARLSHHGHGVGNAVIGGIGVCPPNATACPSSRANGRADGAIVRGQAADGSDANSNFIGTIDEVAIYNNIMPMATMKRHLHHGGDTKMA